MMSACEHNPPMFLRQTFLPAEQNLPNYADKTSIKGKERKRIYTMYISKRSGMDHTVLPANTPCLPFLRMRSPDGATSN